MSELTTAGSVQSGEGNMIKGETLAQGKAEMHEPVPNNFGFMTPDVWVSLSIVAIIVVALWQKVPKMLTSSLDSSIAEIKKQLDEAKDLRAEAEALRKEYADKIANAEKDAAAMLEHARHEAEAIVAKAEADTAAVIARREKMAEDKIAATELSAIAELRATAAAAAAAAARGLIAKNYGADADRAQVDKAIAEI